MNSLLCLTLLALPCDGGGNDNAPASAPAATSESPVAKSDPTGNDDGPEDAPTDFDSCTSSSFGFMDAYSQSTPPSSEPQLPGVAGLRLDWGLWASLVLLLMLRRTFGRRRKPLAAMKLQA